MTLAIIAASALTGALLTGLGLGLWLRRETQRADGAEAALVGLRAVASNAVIDREHAEERLALARGRHDKETAILREQIVAAYAALEQCRDPAVVRELLREALS